MSKIEGISLYQRAKELLKLIDDAKKLNFDSALIRNYEAQLTEIQEELKEINDKRLRVKELGKIEIKIQKSQDKGEVMDLTGRREVLLDEINSKVIV